MNNFLSNPEPDQIQGNDVDLMQSHGNNVLIADDNGQITPSIPRTHPSSIKSSELTEGTVPFKANGKDCFFHLPSENTSTDCCLTLGYLCDSFRDRKIHLNSSSLANHYHNRYYQFVPVKPIFLSPPVKPSLTRSGGIALDSAQAVDIKSDDVVVPCSVSSEDVKVFSHPDTTPNSNTKAKPVTCSHCDTDATSLWRRIEDKLMCNACALYYKLHGIMRPLHLSTGIIKRRNRIGSGISKRHRRHKC